MKKYYTFQVHGGIPIDSTAQFLVLFTKSIAKVVCKILKICVYFIF